MKEDDPSSTADLTGVFEKIKNERKKGLKTPISNFEQNSSLDLKKDASNSILVSFFL